MGAGRAGRHLEWLCMGTEQPPSPGPCCWGSLGQSQVCAGNPKPEQQLKSTAPKKTAPRFSPHHETFMAKRLRTHMCVVCVCLSVYVWGSSFIFLRFILGGGIPICPNQNEVSNTEIVLQKA